MDWWVVLSEPKLIDELRKAPEHILSASRSLSDVSNADGRVEPIIYHLITGITIQVYSWLSSYRKSLPYIARPDATY